MIITDAADRVPFHRTITGPMRELVERTNSVDRATATRCAHCIITAPANCPAVAEFPRHGAAANTRSSFISTFATHVSHELKSPHIHQGRGRTAARIDAPDMDVRTGAVLDNIIADRPAGDDRGPLRNSLGGKSVALGAAKLSVAVASLRSAFLAHIATGDLRNAVRISDDNILIIFSNLADNAVRHGSSVLEVSAARDGNWLKVTVSDDGEGVSPNNRTQIFDSFFTPRRDSGGTGMGLAIVRAMLDAHGGAVRLIDSEKGTAFELTFPVTDAATA
jgi:hypothetical protein